MGNLAPIDAVWPFGTAIAYYCHMLLARPSFSLISARSGHCVPVLQQTLCRLSLLVIPAALLSGCFSADECDYGQVDCNGNTARTCVASERYAQWQTEDCGTKTCVLTKNASGTSVALCALSAEPEPRCVGSEGPNCAGNTLVECTYGYATATQACAAGCLTLDDYPDRCADAAALDPEQCTAGNDGYLCATASGNMTGVMSAFPIAGVCSENTIPVTPGYAVYSQRCVGGSIVARSRCAQGCNMLTDCTTSCS